MAADNCQLQNHLWSVRVCQNSRRGRAERGDDCIEREGRNLPSDWLTDSMAWCWLFVPGSCHVAGLAYMAAQSGSTNSAPLHNQLLPFLQPLHWLMCCAVLQIIKCLHRPQISHFAKLLSCWRTHKHLQRERGRKRGREGEWVGQCRWHLDVLKYVAAWVSFISFIMKLVCIWGTHCRCT